MNYPKKLNPKNTANRNKVDKVTSSHQRILIIFASIKTDKNVNLFSYILCIRSFVSTYKL